MPTTRTSVRAEAGAASVMDQAILAKATDNVDVEARYDELYGP